jgi:hypothetical protein
MDLRNYWNLPPSGQGSQDEIIKQSIPPYVPGRCGGIVEMTEPREASVNPCLALYGPGPDGMRCKSCSHMRAKRQDKVYWKCDLRKNTNGAGTDHRRNWPACGRFEPIAV